MRFLADSAGSPGTRTAIIGSGAVGSCLAAVLAQRGLNVVAVDTDPDRVADLRAGRCRVPEPGLAEAVADLAGTGRLTATTDYDAIGDVDVIVIAVGTPVDRHGELLTGQLADACKRLSSRLRPGQLVVLKSTVSPGTTRTLAAPLLEAGGLAHEVDFGLAFCPERLAEGAALAQLRHLPVVVGGCGPASTAAAGRFWARALGVPVHTVPSAEVAELVKLATNWWIDANIALANELARYCAAYDADVLDVVRAANTLPKGDSRVNILVPSVGVGGSCLTKDPWMAWRSARERGVRLETVETGRRVNERMPAYTAGLIRSELVRLGRRPAAATVAVLGAAFKSNTGDLRNTPVRGVVEALRAAGVRVRLHDPLADPAELADVFGTPPTGTVDAAVDGADCVAVLAGHDEFHALDFAALRSRVASPCLVFDGRMYLPAERIRALRALGYAYRGIGR